MHPIIIDTSLQAFSCINISDDKTPYTVLEKDLEMKCWESYHMFWAFVVALPSLIIWGVGIPLASFVILLQKKQNLDKMSVRASYGFLYEGYQSKYFYWEMIVLYRKLAIITISVFLNRYSIYL